MTHTASPKTKCLLISGPTAVGKTALSLSLAEALKGEIVNIDSVQVYREADIGSAKASPEERARMPHHLIDILHPGEPSDIASFRERVHETVLEIASRGRLPILVGGSGMYITALFQGLSSLPRGSAEIREELEGRGPDDLWNELKESDPDTAQRLYPTDKLRIVRALEVIRLTGRPMSESYEQREDPRIVGIMLVLVRNRSQLYESINTRSHEMVQHGLLEETQGIVERYGSTIPLLKSLGYAQALQVLEGKLSRDELSQDIALHTRRYAKRQMTFWRNEPEKRGWRIRPEAGEEGVEIADAGFRVFPWPQKRVAAEIEQRLALPVVSNEVWFLPASALAEDKA